MLLKSDITNEAFSILRISGITVQASASDNVLALGRLESLAAELEERNVCLSYNFQEKPDSNDSLGVKLSYKYALSCILAQRLLSDFGKGQQPDPSLIVLANSGASYLQAATAVVREVQPPTRQPIGSGNELRHSRYNTFYKPVVIAPNSCDTNKMFVDDLNDFAESFSAYLVSGEDIASYTLEADTGLTVTAQSISTSLQEILYTIRADGNSEIASDTYLRVKIVVTTTEGRVETRVIDFSLKLVETV